MQVPGPPSAEMIASAAALVSGAKCGRERVRDALVLAIGRWRDHSFPPRRETLEDISRMSGFSLPLLDESLDALLKPFTSPALSRFAACTRECDGIVGFVMPGNVAGAGLHELVISMLAGAGAIIKAGSREPVFFWRFARTLS
ncbi:MAG TPA: hypothetical protein VIX12_06435, partial [Candidatus Binataceae bacterium]